MDAFKIEEVSSVCYYMLFTKEAAAATLHFWLSLTHSKLTFLSVEWLLKRTRQINHRQFIDYCKTHIYTFVAINRVAWTTADVHGDDKFKIFRTFFVSVLSYKVNIFTYIHAMRSRDVSIVSTSRNKTYWQDSLKTAYYSHRQLQQSHTYVCKAKTWRKSSNSLAKYQHFSQLENPFNLYTILHFVLCSTLQTATGTKVFFILSTFSKVV